MGEMHIIQARREDVPALAQLKYAYVCNLYRGFLPLEALGAIRPEYYVEQFEGWMDEKHYTVHAAVEDGAIRAFVVFGENPDQPGCGLVYEACCDQTFCMEDKRVLMDSALEHVRKMGFTTVHQWILRDNFRVRVVFESLGFRPDGERRSVEQNGQELILARYVYNL